MRTYTPVHPYTRGVQETGSDGKGGNGIPVRGHGAVGGSAESPWLAVFCSGLLRPETGVHPAYGFVVVSCVGFPKSPSRGSLEALEPRWSARGGGRDRNGPTGHLEWEIVHSHAALLEDGTDGDLHLGLGEKALLAV